MRPYVSSHYSVCCDVMQSVKVEAALKNALSYSWDVELTAAACHRVHSVTRHTVVSKATHFYLIPTFNCFRLYNLESPYEKDVS